jgi:hypothetical protein
VTRLLREYGALQVLLELKLGFMERKTKLTSQLKVTEDDIEQEKMADDKWEKVKDDNGQIYWWNTQTNESCWTEPPNASEKTKALPTSPVIPPAPPRCAPPPPNGNGNASPAQTSAKLGSTASSQSMPKKNSMRLRGLGKKEDSKKDLAVPVDLPPNTWEARRKKSFQAAVQAVQAVKTKLDGAPPDPLTIDGHLQLQARETNRDVAQLIREVEISPPFDVQKKVQVRFDEENIRFSGIPEGWADEAHRQFGIPIQNCPRTEVTGYSDRIPLVLVKLKARFVQLGGVEAEGVFRLAPDGQDVADAKLFINTGNSLKSLEKTKDPHVVANLIKQFYRELKPKILNSLSKEDIIEVSALTSLDEVGSRLTKLGDPQKSAFFWLLDLLCEVAAHQEVNRMTPTNLAIVMSPNLYDAGPNMDPFEELVLSQKVAAFTSNCLKWRIESRKV